MFLCQYNAYSRMKYHDMEIILYLPNGWPQSSTPSMQVTPQIVSVALDATRPDTPPANAAARIARLIVIMRQNCYEDE